MDEAVLLDVDADLLSVPELYRRQYNISLWPAAVRVGSRDSRSDILVSVGVTCQVTCGASVV
eukprot:588001-Rhodomonas_salina.1